MVGVEGGASELVSLTAVDFLTGELIVNSLVEPRQPVVDWRTQVHGISPAGLSMARAQGLALDGWQTARAELFKHVGQDTVLIGHSLQYDLAALHTRHERVVDSAILASEAVFSKTGKPRYWGLGLKDVCSDLLGLKIREQAPLGVSKVHDGLEDVLATREVVLCYLEQPTVFKAWARGKRNSFWRTKSRKAPLGKSQTRRQQTYPRPNDRNDEDEDEDEDEEYMSDEVLRWEDVIDYEMWPKSP
ncbi:putative transcription factor truly c2h2 [Diaporthe ampelina]|uniref:Putative transcription factor truly c2h2 n=1 Tax=Diaporthe ampelina TaxID=1214573 RepID=A0A0G2FY92_9PEZI|nr:putative transcription factor truly c2h2 [Diaporthe ampelina]